MGEKLERPTSGTALLRWSAGVIASAFIAAVLKNCVDRLAPSDKPLPGWIVWILTWIPAILAATGWVLAYFGSRRREHAWREKETEWTTAQEEAVKRERERQDDSLDHAIRSLKVDLVAAREGARAAEADRERLSAEVDVLRKKLTPADEIAGCIKRMDEHKRTVGQYTFSALWALWVIGDESGVIRAVLSDQLKWTSVQRIVEVALKFSRLPPSATNVENALPQIGPLMWSLPPTCVLTDKDSQDNMLFFITPFGRKVLFWAEILSVSVRPIP